MSKINLETAQTQLDTWLLANIAVASGQSYKIDMGGTSRQLTRVNSKEILEQIKFWQRQISILQNNGNLPIKYTVPTEC